MQGAGALESGICRLAGAVMPVSSHTHIHVYVYRCAYVCVCTPFYVYEYVYIYMYIYIVRVNAPVYTHASRLMYSGLT